MKVKYAIRVFLIAPLVFFTHVSSFAQTEKYMVAFTYQFTRYINWPATSSVFVIGIVGNSAITPHLQQLSKEKKVGTSTISIAEWGSAGEIGTCNILIIPESQTSNLSSILSKVAGKPVLVITESSGTIKNGAGISFGKKDGKIQFELNKSAITKSGLSMASDLERMATKVY
jgi:hypothetical protein